MKAEDQLISVSQAASIMGLHYRYVRKLCATGKIGCTRVGRIYAVYRKCAEAYVRDPYGRGRPKDAK